MTVFDGISACLVGFSIVLGAWRGLVWEAVSLLGWVASFWIAQKTTPALAHWLNWQGFWSIVGFVLLFLASLLFFGLMSAVLKKGVKAIGLRPIDRSLGAIFGCLRGVLWIWLWAILILATPLHEHAFWQQASLRPLCVQSLNQLKVWFPDYLAKVIP
jgi:membrane protein required for colicin V production